MEYEVSPDIREKEKVVGGMFTMTQTVFLGLAFVCGGGFGIMTFSATGNIPLAIFIIVLGSVPFLPFAFIKIPSMGDMELFRYLMIRIKYKKSQKVYVNYNENSKKALLDK